MVSRVKSLPYLKDKADEMASKYIRQKYADHNGMVKCCTCPTVKHWKEVHCAHYVERGKTAVRWEEENLHPACPSCNVYRKEYHKREYTLYMIDLYGREKIDELNLEGRRVLKPSEVRNLAEEAIDYYTKALNSLV